MADKKLNAVSTAKDGAYIYAEDSSGNQIKISKADLASVVAGIIGIKPGLSSYSYSEFKSGAIALEGEFTWSGGMCIIEGLNAANGFSYFKIAVANNSDGLTNGGIHLLESSGNVPDVYFSRSRIVIFKGSSRYLFKITSTVHANISTNTDIEGLTKMTF